MGVAIGGCNNSTNNKADVWYTYTHSGADKIITLSLCNSSFDTTIGVYTDCNLSTEIAYNDDSCDLQSEVTFLAQDGVNYVIIIEGYDEFEEGAYELAISCTLIPENDECVNLESLSLGTQITANNAGASNSGTLSSCGEAADMWYWFMAPASQSVNISCTAEAWEAYSGTDCNNLTSLGCSPTQLSGLTAFSQYYIRVSDGPGFPIARQSGAFTLLVQDASTLANQDIENVAAFTLYPNPAQNELNIHATHTIDNVKVYNMLGQTVLENYPNAMQTKIQVSHLQAGAYFVQVSCNGKLITRRILKQ